MDTKCARQFGWAILLSVLILAACSSQPADTSTTAVNDSEMNDVETVSTLQIVVVSDDFAIPLPRIPFVLYDGSEKAADVQQVKLSAFDLSQEPPVSGWSGTAIGYNEFEVPYWVAYAEVPHAGIWGLSAEITMVDRTTTQAQFTIEVKAEALSPDIGDAVPASQNRTLATEPDIEKLTSDSSPNLAFYQMTVADALVNKLPSVIIFSTPAFCQTAICGPVLNSFEEVFESLGDKANFIHLEIYKEFNPELILADEVTEWKLSSEPWTFVLDDQGRVAARLGGPVSPHELTAVLEPLLR